MELNATESIFFQTLATTSLLTELGNMDFLNSEYYQNLHFSSNNDIIKTILKESALGNPATLQMFLYTLLVMPKEILMSTDDKYAKKCEEEFDAACKKLIVFSGLAKDVRSNYSDNGDINSFKFYNHMRNAVAHSRCSYKVVNDNYFVTFEDVSSNRKSRCEFTLKTGDVEALLRILQRQLMIFLNEKMSEK